MEWNKLDFSIKIPQCNKNPLRKKNRTQNGLGYHVVVIILLI